MHLAGSDLTKIHGMQGLKTSLFGLLTIDPSILKSTRSYQLPRTARTATAFYHTNRTDPSAAVEPAPPFDEVAQRK